MADDSDDLRNLFRDGFCRRHAPRPITVTDDDEKDLASSTAEWPWVSRVDWCGDYELAAAGLDDQHRAGPPVPRGIERDDLHAHADPEQPRIVNEHGGEPDVPPAT